jgi:hypothetical protein
MSSHFLSASLSQEPTTNQTPLVSPSVSRRARHAHSPQVFLRSPPTTDRLPSSIGPNRRSSQATADKVLSWLLLPRRVVLSSTVRHDFPHPPTSTTTSAKATHRSVALPSIHSALLSTHPLPTRALLPACERPLGRLLMTVTVVAMKSRRSNPPGERSLEQALRDLRTDPGLTRPSEPTSPVC